MGTPLARADLCEPYRSTGSNSGPRRHISPDARTGAMSPGGPSQWRLELDLLHTYVGSMPCARDGQIRAIGALRAPSSFFDSRAGPRVDFPVCRALPRYHPSRETYQAGHVLGGPTQAGENELYSPRERLLRPYGARA